MAWKNLSYWLKGLIVGGIIDVVVLLAFFVMMLLQYEGAQYGYWVIFYVPFAVCVLVLSIVVGLIVGKIKRSKK